MKYNTELMQTILTSPKAREIVDQVSPVYGQSYVGLWLFQVLGQELDLWAQRTRELPEQAFPAKATWALAYWEDMLGLGYNRSLPLEQRRQRILSRLRERSPMNAERLRLLVEAAANGSRVYIRERIAKNTFEVVLNQGDGVVQLGEVSQTIRRAKPAQLLCQLVFERCTQLEVGTKVRAYPFAYAATNTLVAGTHPQRNTLGALLDPSLVLRPGAQGFPLAYPLTGTLPWRILEGLVLQEPLALEPQTQGFPLAYTPAGTVPGVNMVGHMGTAPLMIPPAGAGFLLSYPLTGRQKAGTYPQRNTLGLVLQEPLALRPQAQGFPLAYGATGVETTGTRPHRSTVGAQGMLGLTAQPQPQGYRFPLGPKDQVPAGTWPLPHMVGGLGILALQPGPKGQGYGFAYLPAGTHPQPNLLGGQGEREVDIQLTEDKNQQYAVKYQKCGTNRTKRR